MSTDHTLIVVLTRDGVVVLRRPPSLAQALAGATNGTYGDPEAYLQAERATWR